MNQRKENYLVEIGHGFEIDGERGFKRGDYIPYQTVNLFIKKCNKRSVFTSIYRYQTADVDKSTLYGDMYLDFDDIDNFEHVRNDAITALSYLKICYHITEDEVQIYYSGNKGIHIIIPAEIFDIEPITSLNGVFKTIASSIKTYTKYKTIDTQIYDNKRLFRIPNTIHEKSNLYKIPITIQELRTLSESGIKSMAMHERIFPKQQYRTNPVAARQFKKDIEEFYLLEKELKKDKRFKTVYNFTPPCIQHILDNGAKEGERNITIACLTGFCKNSGKSLNETIDFITEWNSNNIKPTGEREMQKTIRSIFMGDKIFGCSTLKTISVCNENTCKLSKKRGKNNEQRINSKSSINQGKR